MNQSPDTYSALILGVPDEHFSDEDDICLQAGLFISRKLGPHLKENGHDVPDWLGDGCEEDWGVYFESKKNELQYSYTIGFIDEGKMILQYDTKTKFLKRILKGPDIISPDDQIHGVMKSFGSQFNDSDHKRNQQKNLEPVATGQRR